jgi:hypothetical protein
MVWTTLKTESERKREQQRVNNLTDDSSSSARTHFPECRAFEVLDLNHIFYSSRVDYFRCGACDCWWVVPKGKVSPAIRMKFGKPMTARSGEQAGCRRLLAWRVAETFALVNSVAVLLEANAVRCEDTSIGR